MERIEVEGYESRCLGALTLPPTPLRPAEEGFAPERASTKMKGKVEGPEKIIRSSRHLGFGVRVLRGLQRGAGRGGGSVAVPWQRTTVR